MVDTIEWSLPSSEEKLLTIWITILDHIINQVREEQDIFISYAEGALPLSFDGSEIRSAKKHRLTGEKMHSFIYGHGQRLQEVPGGWSLHSIRNYRKKRGLEISWDSLMITPRVQPRTKFFWALGVVSVPVFCFLWADFPVKWDCKNSILLFS